MSRVVVCRIEPHLSGWLGRVDEEDLGTGLNRNLIWRSFPKETQLLAADEVIRWCNAKGFSGYCGPIVSGMIGVF